MMFAIQLGNYLQLKQEGLFRKTLYLENEQHSNNDTNNNRNNNTIVWTADSSSSSSCVTLLQSNVSLNIRETDQIVFS
jgi:hypothetical protein